MRWWATKQGFQGTLSAAVLVVAVIVAVYYPAISAGIHPIDDPGIFGKFSVSPPVTTLFSFHNGYYFRPLVELSFSLDNLFWGMEPSTMHLENILLHCANSLLVFMLGRKMAGSKNEAAIGISLLAALLFALHPANVETVAWIAGRSDALLSLFVLSATLCWLNWLDRPHWRYCFSAFLLTVGACLAKETAIVFAAVTCLFVLFWPGAATRAQRWLTAGVIGSFALLAGIVALLCQTDAIARFISSANSDLPQNLWLALTALGFYCKKLFLPLPLNFAIVSVHPLYGLLGLAVLLVMVPALIRFRWPAMLCVMALLFIAPALLIAVKQVAWTPYAERYLYLPSAFFALAVACTFEGTFEKNNKLLLPLSAAVLLISAATVFQRNTLWKHQRAFFEDAVAKSPSFGSLHYSLGSILLKDGKVDCAAAEFAAADHLNRRASMHWPIKAGIMSAMLAEGRNTEVRSLFFKLFKKKDAAPDEFLEILLLADSRRFSSLKEHRDKEALGRDLLDTLNLLYVRKPDPFWLYRSGQITFSLKNDPSAKDFFWRSLSTAPNDAHYRPACIKYLRKLEVRQ